MCKRLVICLGAVGLLLVLDPVKGQSLPPATLVSIPTAGTLERGSYEVELLMQTGGGVLGRLGVGFAERFSLGMSYGVQQFIGDQKPFLNRTMPEAQLKYRLFEEGYNMPAIALGLDTQGRGAFQTYDDTLDETTNDGSLIIEKYERYQIKAIGIYVVASKNWQVFGNFGTHLGVSKNVLEEDASDSDLNLFFGIDKEFSPDFSGFIEFNAALDDNNYSDELKDLEDFTIGKGKGYLNAGIRWHVAPSFYMEIDFNDIIKNKGHVESFSRELKVVYSDYF